MNLFLIIFGIVIMLFLAKAEKEYLKNYKLYINILLLYVITTIIIFVIGYSKLKDIIEINFYDKIIFFIGSMSISLIIDSLFVKIFQIYNEKRAIKIIEKKIQGEKIEYIYYREILNNYSPAILAFLYNKKINLDDVIVSTLLNLEKRKIIELENAKIKLHNNIENLEITRYEKNILLYCEKIGQFDERSFKRTLCSEIKEEAITKELIYNSNSKKFNAAYIMEFIMAWLIVYILFTILFFVEVSTLGIWLIAAYALTFACIPIYKGIQSKINPIVKTKEGIEIKAKLNGLKKYIEDFSNIQNDHMEQVELFDDYVIYAIIFDLPGKLNKEVKELYIYLKEKI